MNIDYYSLFLSLRYAAEAAHQASALDSFSKHETESVRKTGEIWIAADIERCFKNMKEAANRAGFELVEKEKPATEPQVSIHETTLYDIPFQILGKRLEVKGDTTNPAASESITEIHAPDNPTEEHHVTAPDDILSTAGEALKTSPAPQDSEKAVAIAENEPAEIR